MRTYQRVNAANGFEAVGNSLVVGTAIIWVPLLALWMGWGIFSKWAEIGEHSPKAVAAQKAKDDAYKAAKWQQTIRVDHNAEGDIIWVNPNGIKASPSGVLPIADKYAPKHSWTLAAGAYIYELRDEKVEYWRSPCVNKYFLTIHELSGKQTGSGCYEIVNSTIVVTLGERTIYFDKSAAMEGIVIRPQVGSVDRGRRANTVIASKPAPKPRQSVEEATAKYEKATAAYNLACPYGCQGEPLRQWQKARDNLALAKAN